MPFKLENINVGLTYPQCNVDKQSLYDRLLSLKSGDTSVLHLLVAKETHGDGSYHYHVYVRFSKRPAIRDERFFDFDGYHPNIQGLRSRKDWIKYITKEDSEPLANFDFSEKQSKASMVVARIRETNGNNKRTFEDCLDIDPTLIRCFGSVNKYIESRNGGSRVSVPLFDYTSFKISDADRARISVFRTHIESSRFDRTSVRSLWFVGPSMVGKTSFARSLGPHWCMTNSWNLDAIVDAEKTYGVLDDLPWSDFRTYGYKSILGAHKDPTFTGKFRGQKHFDWGYRVIVTSNELPDFSSEERAWLRLNVDFLYIGYNLFQCNDIVPEWAVLNI